MRGSFVRWCAQNDVTSLEGFRSFDVAGYGYNEGFSAPGTMVFTR